MYHTCISFVLGLNCALILCLAVLGPVRRLAALFLVAEHTAHEPTDMDKLYSNARQHLVLALGAAFSLSMGAFYLYARSIHHEPTRKSLLFAQATVFLVMLLYQVLRRYLYVVLIKQADWSAAARKWLKRAYFVFCCCVLSVHPIGRGLAVVLPAT